MRFKQFRELLGSQRHAEIIALGLVTTMRLQKAHLCFCFNTLTDNLLPQTFGHSDHRPDNGDVV